MNKEVDVIIL